LLLLGQVARDSCTSVGTVGFAESARVMYLVLPVCACVQDEIVSDEGSKRSFAELEVADAGHLYTHHRSKRGEHEGATH
jgi:hypothetical protein